MVFPNVTSKSKKEYEYNEEIEGKKYFHFQTHDLSFTFHMVKLEFLRNMHCTTAAAMYTYVLRKLGQEQEPGMALFP